MVKSVCVFELSTDEDRVLVAQGDSVVVVVFDGSGVLTMATIATDKLTILCTCTKNRLINY